MVVVLNNHHLHHLVALQRVPICRWDPLSHLPILSFRLPANLRRQSQLSAAPRSEIQNAKTQGSNRKGACSACGSCAQAPRLFPLQCSGNVGAKSVKPTGPGCTQKADLLLAASARRRPVRCQLNPHARRRLGACGSCTAGAHLGSYQLPTAHPHAAARSRSAGPQGRALCTRPARRIGTPALSRISVHTLHAPDHPTDQHLTPPAQDLAPHIPVSCLSRAPWVSA